MNRSYIKILLSIVALVLIAGCAAVPETSKFFTAKRYRKSQMNFGLPIYPDGFIDIDQRDFCSDDKAFFIFYFNKDSSARFHIKFYDAKGKFSQQDSYKDISCGTYYYFIIPILAYINKYGEGKHRADLYRNDVKIDSLYFNLKKSRRED